MLTPGGEKPMRRLLMNVSCVSICLLFCLFVIQPLPCNGDSFTEEKEYSSVLQQEVPPEILRFHVRADSNNFSDQQVKNEVAARILERYSSAWRECGSRAELNRLLAQEQEAITETARRVLQEQGFEQHVAVRLERSTFPARLYEDNYYPPGEYEALVVVLGAGQGENWWCVIFPPLCFNVFPAPACASDINDGCVSEQKDQVLPAEGRDSEQTDIGEAKEENKWRFWVVDYFKQG